MPKTARMTFAALKRWIASIAFALICAHSPSFGASPEQAPRLAPGMARVWFLQELVPGSSFYAPMIYANGAQVAISPEGTAFYRDYTPGTYLFSVENCVTEPQTSQQLTIGPNQQFALQVQTDEEDVAFDCTLYYLTQVMPQDVSMTFAPLHYLGQK